MKSKPGGMPSGLHWEPEGGPETAARRAAKAGCLAIPCPPGFIESGCGTLDPWRMQMELDRVAGSSPAGSNIFCATVLWGYWSARNGSAEQGTIRGECRAGVHFPYVASCISFCRHGLPQAAVQPLPEANEMRGCGKPGPRRMQMELHRLLSARSRVRIPPAPPFLRYSPLGCLSATMGP